MYQYAVERFTTAPGNRKIWNNDSPLEYLEQYLSKIAALINQRRHKDSYEIIHNCRFVN